MAPVVYYLAGVPASGKSSIFRSVIAALLPAPTPFQAGKVRGLRQGAVAVLGVYDGGKFDGTDRLPMDVIEDAIAFCQQSRFSSDLRAILVEGDRLLNRRFLDATSARIIVIDASPEELRRRHQARRDTQDPAFLQRCRTKVANICKAYGVHRYMNNTPADAERLVAWLVNDIKQKTDGKVL